VSQVDHKDVLQQYLPEKRGSLLSRLDGLDEGQLRQPMTRTGTNLLGLVKHVASVQPSTSARSPADRRASRCPGWRRTLSSTAGGRRVRRATRLRPATATGWLPPGPPEPQQQRVREPVQPPAATTATAPS
jgi:hypothetical protein